MTLDKNDLGRWPGGINNVADVHDLGATRYEPEFLRDGLNIDLTKDGKPSRRGGQTLLTAGAAHSAFSHVEWPWGLYVQAGALVRINDDLSTVTLKTVHPDARFSYDVQNEILYCSNGVETLKLDQNGQVLPWGVADPMGQPLLSATGTGGFPAGKYLVAVTFINNFGEESGSEEATAIDVGDDQGIMLTSIPQPPDSTHLIRIYCSPTNGDALYSWDQVPYGVTSHFLLWNGFPGRLLETQFMRRVPPCTIVRSYKGRLYFAMGKRMGYTQALRYGLYKPTADYLDFPANMTMIEPVQQGMYIGTPEHTFYLDGDDPKKMKQVSVQNSGVVEGSSLGLDATRFPEKDDTPSPGSTAVWWSTGGQLLKGDSAGVVQSYTHDRLSLPKFERGATMFRELNGMKQLVSVLSNPSTEGFVARDTVVTEVRRNGVLIP